MASVKTNVITKARDRSSRVSATLQWGEEAAGEREATKRPARAAR